MSENVAKLTELLQVSAPGTTLAPGGTPNSHLGVATVAGVKIVVLLLDNNMYLIVNWGYLPKDNLAPLYRRLLSTNYNLIVGGICLHEDKNQLAWKCGHPMDGLTAPELTRLLNAGVTTYYQILVPLVSEFGIPETAP